MERTVEEGRQRGRWRFVGQSALLAVGMLAMGCELLSEDPSEACALYACVNYVVLSGGLTVSAATEVLDVELCYDDDCRTAELSLEDLVGPNGEVCDGAPDPEACVGPAPGVHWDDLGAVVVGLPDVDGVRDVTAAIGAYGWMPQAVPDDEVFASLYLADHDTGAVLLDVTWNPAPVVTREDACHRCWQASATFTASEDGWVVQSEQ